MADGKNSVSTCSVMSKNLFLASGNWQWNQETLLGAGKTVFSQNKITEM